MPLRLEVKKELSARSDRVKSVDLFPSERPWVLSALYNGKVFIWDYSSNTLVKSFELCEVPVRCAKFIVRKQWIVAGTDDMYLRVYNFNTMDKVKEWEAHNDYIRYVEVHPNRPLILSSSDDMTIKMWDWEKDFSCVMSYEGHSHYVMMVKINPRDSNTFASASLDRTIKVWGLTTSTSHFSLEGHEKGVNCIDYYPGGDKPYLLSGADDRTVKIWDYQTKACLQTLESHSHNIASVCFHPRLPLIVSASEDGTVRLWHSTTYRPETTLNYGMERAWALSASKDANKLAIGYDEGTIVIKLGNERPVASLDMNTGKLVWAHGHEIQTMSVKGLAKEGDIQDGEKLSLNVRDLGSCEVYPQHLEHNNNGSFIVVCGDGEYIIYTSQALRNKAYGSALDFVWSSHGTGDFAIRESTSRVKTFKNFKDNRQIVLPISSADGIFGGHLLGVKNSDSIVFFDWESGEFIQKIDVSPSQVFWNTTGDHVVLVCSDTYYVLTFKDEVVQQAIANGNVNADEGVDGSFELISSNTEKVKTGQWVGDCFLYTNGSGNLLYYVGGSTMNLVHLNYPMYLLGFVHKEDRIFLIDKTYNVVSYKLLLSVLNYQTAVVRGDFDTANAILPTIPPSEYLEVAKFLESQGFKEEALAVTPDPDHKFELAIDLRRIEIAKKVLMESESRCCDTGSTEANSRWRRLGDLALAHGDIDLAQHCAKLSGDLSGLLLLYSASSDRDGMVSLGDEAARVGRINVAFVAYFVTGQVEKCIQLLIDHDRIPEACLMARTYMPSMISSTLELWKKNLSAVNEKAAEALADPVRYPNLFPDIEWALQVEAIFKAGRDAFVPASSYPSAKSDLDLNLIEIVKSQAMMEAEEENNDMEPEESSVSSPSSSVPNSPIRVAEDVPVSHEPNVELQESEDDNNAMNSDNHVNHDEDDKDEEMDHISQELNHVSLSPSAHSTPSKAFETQGVDEDDNEVWDDNEPVIKSTSSPKFHNASPPAEKEDEFLSDDDNNW